MLRLFSFVFFGLLSWLNGMLIGIYFGIQNTFWIFWELLNRNLSYPHYHSIFDHLIDFYEDHSMFNNSSKSFVFYFFYFGFFMIWPIMLLLLFLIIMSSLII